MNTKSKRFASIRFSENWLEREGNENLIRANGPLFLFIEKK